MFRFVVRGGFNLVTFECLKSWGFSNHVATLSCCHLHYVSSRDGDPMNLRKLQWWLFSPEQLNIHEGLFGVNSTSGWQLAVQDSST